MLREMIEDLIDRHKDFFTGDATLGDFFCVALLDCTVVAVVGAAGLGVVDGYDTLRNPTYSYTDNDNTTVDVTPRENTALHRLSNIFGRSANFNSDILCDVKIGSHTKYIAVPSGKGVTTFVPVTVEDTASYNCRSFKNASAHDQAEISEMRDYLAQAKAAHTFRLSLP